MELSLWDQMWIAARSASCLLIQVSVWISHAVINGTVVSTKSRLESIAKRTVGIRLHIHEHEKTLASNWLLEHLLPVFSCRCFSRLLNSWLIHLATKVAGEWTCSIRDYHDFKKKTCCIFLKTKATNMGSPSQIGFLWIYPVVCRLMFQADVAPAWAWFTCNKQIFLCQWTPVDSFTPRNTCSQWTMKLRVVTCYYCLYYLFITYNFYMHIWYHNIDTHISNPNVNPQNLYDPKTMAQLPGGLIHVIISC